MTKKTRDKKRGRVCKIEEEKRRDLKIEQKIRWDRKGVQGSNTK
jgi:hypothetical protein